MILVDTSVWVDHLRVGDAVLRGLLERGAVLCHPWVIGELALGQLSNRREVLSLLARLPAATLVSADELLVFVEGHRIMGRGIGWVDAQLLAATKITPDARLWSRDRRLVDVAATLGLAAPSAVLQE